MTFYLPEFTAIIIGRPNVGKSTLFNYLIQRRQAIVADYPGVTRDWHEGVCQVSDDISFRLIDSAGFENAAISQLVGRMWQQALGQLKQSDLCLFTIDARIGITEEDLTLAKIIRKSGKKVVVLANKAENISDIEEIPEIHRLGFPDIVLISAVHSLGGGALFEKILPLLTISSQTKDETVHAVSPINIAVVGRPNAGKSTFINAILAQERCLTGSEAGTTRDSVAIRCFWDDLPVIIHDTAGMRKQALIQEDLEKMSVEESLKAIQFAEVVLVIIDANEYFARQDLQIIDWVTREGRLPIVIVNKWDSITDKKSVLNELKKRCEHWFPQLGGIAVLTISALKNKGLDEVLVMIKDLYARWNRKLPTAQLNMWLQEVTQINPPPSYRGRYPKMRYMIQKSVRPPAFIIFGAGETQIPESYRRYLVNRLREDFDFGALPLRLSLRRKYNPYAD